MQEALEGLKTTLDLNPNRDVRYNATLVIDLSQ